MLKYRLVWECKQNLILLAKHNKVTLVLVPGYRGIAGNEKADALARKGSANTFTGPEPVFGITKATARTSFLHRLNYNTRYTGPMWQVTGTAS
jgi:hypothetical protein